MFFSCERVVLYTVIQFLNVYLLDLDITTGIGKLTWHTLLLFVKSKIKKNYSYTICNFMWNNNNNSKLSYPFCFNYKKKCFRISFPRWPFEIRLEECRLHNVYYKCISRFYTLHLKKNKCICLCIDYGFGRLLITI